MRIIYFPLEAYEERYTGQNYRWTVGALEKAGHEVIPMKGKVSAVATSIENHGPLDFGMRCEFAASQVAEFAAMVRRGEIREGDRIYFEDMFTPGFEAIPYLLQGYGIQNVRIWGRNLAQSVDVYDFTWPMRRWMKHYEAMFCESSSGIFCASGLHKELMMVAGWNTTIRAVGLTFDKRDAQEAVPDRLPWSRREKVVVFTSRLDSEKLPFKFVQLARLMKGQGFRFKILSGKPRIVSNDSYSKAQIEEAVGDGVLEVHLGLSKQEYYRHLSEARFQINTALQDWVSYTMLESSALEVITLAPSFRGFPECIASPEQLYFPHDVEDIERRIHDWMDRGWNESLYKPADHHTGTMARIIESLQLG